MSARRISVWAPAAKAVDLVAGVWSCPMEASGGGWFANLGEEAILVPEAAGASLLLSSDEAVCLDATRALDTDSVAIWSDTKRSIPG